MQKLSSKFSFVICRLTSKLNDPQTKKSQLGPLRWKIRVVALFADFV